MNINFLLLVRIWQSMQSLTDISLVSTPLPPPKKYYIRIELRFEVFAAVKIYIMTCFIRLHNLVSG
jgi:hypothetical protein